MNKIIFTICLLATAASSYAQSYYDNLTVSEPGTVKKQTSLENWKKIESLKLDGPINGEDLLFLAEISRTGKLKYLELSGAEGLRKLPKATFSPRTRMVDNKEVTDSCKLKGLVLPKTMEEIGDSALADCRKLTDLTLPEELQKIGSCGMVNCTGLRNLALPNELKTIDKYAFAGCKNLQSIMIPDSLQILSEGCFMGDTSLNSVVLPAKTKVIENMAFGNCNHLTMMKINAKEPPLIEGRPFAGCFDGQPFMLFLPKGSKQKYLSKEGWMMFQYAHEE